MLRAIWLKTLRDHRVAMLGWSLALGLTLYATYATAEDVLHAGVAQVYAAFRFYAEPIALDTVAGYVTFRMLSVLMPTTLGIWVLLTGGRLLRAEEERGSLDVLLATPVGRTGLLLQKLAGVTAALLVIALLLAGFIVLGQRSAGEMPAPERALLATLNMAVFELCLLGIACLIAQCVRTAGAAAGWTGGLLLVMFLLDSIGRTVAGAGWLRRLSLYHYYNANKPLIPTLAADWGAVAVMAGLVLVLLALNLALFRRRDLGDVAFRLERGRRRGLGAAALLAAASSLRVASGCASRPARACSISSRVSSPLPARNAARLRSAGR